MNWDDLYKAILEKLKIPQTVDEAIKVLENDEASQVIIEDMAWKQTVLNILVASKIVSEEDFTATITHFKNLFTKQFAEKMIENLEAHKKAVALKQRTDDLDFLDSDDSDDDEIEINEVDDNIAKA